MILRKFTFKRVFLVVSLCCLLLLIAGLVGIWLAGSYFMKSANTSVGRIPAGLNGVDVEFQSASGSLLKGWLVQGGAKRGVVVLCHGVRGNRKSMMDHARFLLAAGYSVLLFDFQAHGESPGDRITFGLLESKDVQAAVGYLKNRFPQEPIAVLGSSLGGAAALLASPPLQVDALIVEMVYPTIEEAVADRGEMVLGKFGRLLAPVLTWQLKPRLGIDPGQLHPIDHVPSIRTPKLFLAGDQDRHTKLEESQRMFAAAAELKELWIVPGADHMDFHAFVPVEYEKRILDFLERNMRSERE